MDVKLDEIEKRLDKLEAILDSVNNLIVQIEKLALETKYLREGQNKLADRVENLEQKPVKRYDTVITSIMTGIVGALIGAAMTLILK